jgi:hypothetical protein
MATSPDLLESSPLKALKKAVLPLLALSTSACAPSVTYADALPTISSTIASTPEIGTVSVLTTQIASEIVRETATSFVDGDISYQAISGSTTFSHYKSGELVTVNKYEKGVQVENKKIAFGEVNMTDGKTAKEYHVLIEYDTKTQERTGYVLHNEQPTVVDGTDVFKFQIAKNPGNNQPLVDTNEELIVERDANGTERYGIKELSNENLVALGLQGSPTAEPTMPNELSLIAFDTKKPTPVSEVKPTIEINPVVETKPTVEPVLVPVGEPTTQPTVEVVQEIPVIKCETDLSDWRKYPDVPDLISKISDGTVAQSLHNQKIFETLMEKKGVKHPFNPDVMIKPVWDIFRRYSYKSFFYTASKETTIAAAKNPEARNIWPVCGFKTTERGLNMIVWAQALPSTESPDGYVYNFVTQGSPDESVKPAAYDKWMSNKLKQMNGKYGGYFINFYDVGDIRQDPAWGTFSKDFAFSWLADTQDRVRYNQADDVAIETWRKTGYAPITIETLIRTGNIRLLKEIN